MIPAETVEAAARVAYEVKPAKYYLDDSLVTWEQLSDSRSGQLRKDQELTKARAALEAAAPYMMAGLRSELVELAQEFDTAEGGTLAYTALIGRFHMRKNAHDQLMYIIDNYLPDK